MYASCSTAQASLREASNLGGRSAWIRRSSHQAAARPNPAIAACKDAWGPPPWLATQLAAGAAAIVLCCGPGDSLAAAPPSTDPGRCTLAALDKFADTRARFSQEASSGAMVEALVDIRGCDFAGANLTTKVMSGVQLQGANLAGANLAGVQMARANASGANLSSVDFTDTNCYGTVFGGADLRGAQFENSILTGATFGRSDGVWANLEGAHFEGALISSSDVGRICENPTLEESTRRNELGCRGTPSAKVR